MHHTLETPIHGMDSTRRTALFRYHLFVPLVALALLGSSCAGCEPEPGVDPDAGDVRMDSGRTDVDATPDVSDARTDGIDGTDPVEVCTGHVDEDGDGWVDCDDPDCSGDVACEGIPPNPSALAPPTARGGVLERYGFIFTPTQPGGPVIQREVDPQELDAERVAHVRGQVIDYTTGDPVAGAKVRALGQGFAGYMPTTQGGVLDMVVHGTVAGETTFSVHAPGYARFQTRTLVSPGADIDLGTLKLLPLAPASPPVNAMAPVMQIIEGPLVTDERGERATTLLMRPNTRVTAVAQDGGQTELSEASVRITEVSVGGVVDGAMSAPLPAYSGYTWAADFTVEQAPDARQVTFDPPVVAHLDEFLDFAPGVRVPLGYYDEREGVWKEHEAATVVRVVEVVDGIASLDVTGGPEADDPATLAALGITDDELAQIGATRAPDDRFWRMELPHFSLWDANTGLACGLDPDPRGVSCSGLEAAKSVGRWLLTPSCQAGSVIECENRTVLQSITLMGTDRRLHHRSDWQPGFSQRRMLRIPLIASNVSPEPNPGAEEFHLRVLVAGQMIHDTVYPSNRARELGHVDLEWDGLDAYGRPADDGVQVAQVVVDVLYPGKESNDPNFNDPTGSPAARAQVRIRPDGKIIRRTRYEVTLEPRFDDSNIGAGGWMLSGYHRLESNGVVRRGDGGVIAPSTRPESTILDADSVGTGPPTGGRLASLRTGEIVMVQGSGRCLVRFDPENPGNEEVILGSCSEQVPTERTISDFAFGQPATDARFGSIAGVHVAPGGDVYVWQTDTFRKNRPALIVRIRPLSEAKGSAFGPLEHIAGNGEYGAFVDDGADDARTQPVQVTDLTVSPNGEVYVAQEEFDCILRVGNRGRLGPFAGQCQESPGSGIDTRYGERLTGSREYFGYPNALDMAPDGQLYVSRSSLGDIVRVSPTGSIEHVAGSSSRVNPEDRFSASPLIEGQDARTLNNGYSGSFIDLVVGADSNMYVLRTSFAQVVRIDAESRAWRFAADLSFAKMVELRATGEVLLAQFFPTMYGETLWRLDPVDGLRVVIDDSGLLAFVFDEQGRHVRTQHSMSHEVLERFIHDASGRLVEVIDLDGRSTVLGRDAATGRLTEVVGPDGQTNTLAYDGDGNLERVTWADGKTVAMAYEAGRSGLLREFTTPRGFTKTYTYSDTGLLETATNELGLTQTYSEEPITEDGRFGRAITRTSPDGRQTRWELNLKGDHESTATIQVDGLGRRQELDRSANTHEVKSSTGDFVRMFFEPGPHFSKMVDRPSASYYVLPSGDTLVTEHTWEATYERDTPTQLATLTRRTTTSGITGEWVSTYDVASHTMTTTSPEGRTSAHVLDEKMRVVESRRGDLAVARAVWDESTGRLQSTSVGDPGEPGGVREQAYEYIEAPGQLETGMIASMTDALGRRTEYDHDLANNLERVMLPALSGAQSDDARTIELERDDDGNLVRMAPFGRDQHIMAYDGQGRQLSGTMPAVSNNPGTSGYTWDDDGMMRSITDVSGGQVTFTYDPDALELATQENSAQAKRYTYDPTSGQLTRVTVTGKQSWASDRGHEYEYDGSRVTGEHYLDAQGARWASIGYGYDDAFRMDLVTIAGSPVIPTTYDNDGFATQMGPVTMTYLPDRPQLDSMTVGTFEMSMGYDAFGALIAVETTETSGDTLLGRTITRDALGRIAAVTETGVGQADVTTLYTYDPQGRLAAVHRDTNGDGTGQPGELFEEYERDERGNEVSLLVAGGAVGGFTVNAQDQVTAHGDTRLSYNALGQADTIEIVGESGRALTLEHDPNHMLRRVGFADGGTRTYDLDAFGHPTHIVDRDANGVTTDEKHYLFLRGSNPIAEVDAAGAPLKTFIYASDGNAPDAIVDEVSGAVLMLIKDERGSVRVVADAATGQVLQRLSYTSHGLVLTDTNPGLQPFGFHGGMHDGRTGFIRFGVRHYFPEIGRFVEPDPLEWTGGHTNLYAYAAFDPVNSSDPTGLVADTPGDLAMLGLSVGLLVRDVAGGCDNLGTNMLAVGADVAAVLVPFASGGGIAVRMGLHTRFMNSMRHGAGAVANGIRTRAGAAYDGLLGIMRRGSKSKPARAPTPPKTVRPQTPPTPTTPTPVTPQAPPARDTGTLIDGGSGNSLEDSKRLMDELGGTGSGSDARRAQARAKMIEMMNKK